jgi:pimeloyl-ACP methyl ester carboxylesterase
MATIDAPMTPFTVTSADGTSIQAWRAGTGPHRVLLSPGMGTPVLCWKYLFEHFADQVTFVTWDPRGCYGSAKPSDPSRIEVADHVADGEAVLASIGWAGGPYVCAGWSMGVELSLELYARHRDDVTGLVLINGAFEHVLKTVTLFPGAERLVDRLLGLGVVLGPYTSPVVRTLLGQEWSIQALLKLGIVSDNEPFFGEVLKEFRQLDFGFYSGMIRALNHHSARALAPTVKVPTLITAGTSDKMTPLATARELRWLIPDAELFVVPNGTHYTTLEYPEIVNLKLDDFFRRRVFPDTWK